MTTAQVEAQRITIERCARAALAKLGINGPDQDDAVQEVWLRLWAAQTEIRCYSAYARMVARNIAFDLIRRRRSSCAPEDVVLIAPVDIHGDAERNELRAILERAISVTLRPLARELMKRYLLEETTEETCVAMGVSPAWYRNTRHRSIVAVASRMQRLLN